MLTPVTVLARITAKAGLEDAVFSELVTLVEKTRREEGCITYDLYRSSSDPSIFTFHETWRSREDLERHFEKPHLLAFRTKAADMLTKPAELSYWDRVC
jgi:quinol monooxygenase YgiN